MTWTRWPRNTWAARPSISRTWPARARSRSASTRSASKTRRRILRRGRRRHPAPAPHAVAATRSGCRRSRSCTTRSRAAGAGAAAHGAPRRAHRRGDADDAERRAAAAACAKIEAQAHERGRRAFQPRFAQAAAGRSCSRRLQLPVMRKTPVGQPSTAEDVLEELAEQLRSCRKLILEYRALAKLRSTYTEKLPEQVECRAPAACTPAITRPWRPPAACPRTIRTCRTSRSAPRRPAHPPGLHRRPGYVLLAADYSQIELRIMAHLSGDEGLLRAFAEGSRHPPGHGSGSLRRAAGYRSPTNSAAPPRPSTSA